jgi:hypothetical protein
MVLSCDPHDIELVGSFGSELLGVGAVDDIGFSFAFE